MIVCVCKAVNEEQVKKLIAKGKTLKEVKQITKATSQCGECLMELETLYKKYKDA